MGKAQVERSQNGILLYSAHLSSPAGLHRVGSHFTHVLSWSQRASVFFCSPHSVFASSDTDVKTHIGWIKRVRMRDGPGEAQVIYEPFHKTIKEKFSLVPRYSWAIPFCDRHHYSHQDNIPFYLLSLLFQGIKAGFHACFQSSLGVKTVPEHKQPGFNASEKKEPWPGPVGRRHQPSVRQIRAGASVIKSELN